MISFVTWRRKRRKIMANCSFSFTFSPPFFLFLLFNKACQICHNKSLSKNCTFNVNTGKLRVCFVSDTKNESDIFFRKNE